MTINKDLLTSADDSRNAEEKVLEDSQNIQKKYSVEESRCHQGITLFFGANRIHLDPLEILFFFLLALPIGIMIRDAPNATFEDAMKEVLTVITTATGIRKFPTDKAYQYLLKVSFDRDDKDE
ncbi:MAG: hypothetical protein V7K47_07050 [Nostoc sp.]